MLVPDGKNYVLELIDPENVNECRKKAYMLPIEGYTKRFGFEWDVERHKKIIAEVKEGKKAAKQ